MQQVLATAQIWSRGYKHMRSNYTQQRTCSRCHCSTGLEPHATAAKPFDLEVDAHSELRYGRRQQTAGVDVTQEAWCSHTQTDLIPSPPPMEGFR